VTSSRLLSLLAYCASPIFMASAVAGWLAGLWPANPVTLGAAAALVAGGPFLGMLHAATAAARPEPVAAPAPAAPPRRCRRGSPPRGASTPGATPEPLARMRR
jgi:hypothetical protein